MREAYVGIASKAMPTHDLVHRMPAIEGKAFVGAQEAGCFVGRFFAIDVERLVQIDDALSCQQGLEEEFVIRRNLRRGIRRNGCLFGQGSLACRAPTKWKGGGAVDGRYEHRAG